MIDGKVEWIPHGRFDLFLFVAGQVTDKVIYAADMDNFSDPVRL